MKNATVVINNNAGVCTGTDSCSRLVKAILPKGSKTTVHHPGSPEKNRNSRRRTGKDIMIVEFWIGGIKKSRLQSI
ncbi:DddA-like double-stranded DNA deaminase toxin [Streptomyces anulatus]